MTGGGGANGRHLPPLAKSLRPERVDAQRRRKILDRAVVFPGENFAVSVTWVLERKFVRIQKTFLLPQRGGRPGRHRPEHWLLSALRGNPRRTGGLRGCDRGALLCTTSAAVTTSLLDRKKTSRFDSA